MPTEPDPPPEPEPGPRPDPDPDPQPARPTLQQVQLSFADLRTQFSTDDPRRAETERIMEFVAANPITGPTTH